MPVPFCIKGLLPTPLGGERGKAVQDRAQRRPVPRVDAEANLGGAGPFKRVDLAMGRRSVRERDDLQARRVALRRGHLIAEAGNGVRQAGMCV